MKNRQRNYFTLNLDDERERKIQEAINDSFDKSCFIKTALWKYINNSDIGNGFIKNNNVTNKEANFIEPQEEIENIDITGMDF